MQVFGDVVVGEGRGEGCGEEGGREETGRRGEMGKEGWKDGLGKVLEGLR